MSNVITEQIADEAALMRSEIRRERERERAADLLRKADDELSASPMPQTSAQKKKRATKDLEAQAWWLATPTPFIKDMPRVSLGHFNFHEILISLLIIVNV